MDLIAIRDRDRSLWHVDNVTDPPAPRIPLAVTIEQVLACAPAFGFGPADQLWRRGPMRPISGTSTLPPGAPMPTAVVALPGRA